jgi:hypothetical protein
LQQAAGSGLCGRTGGAVLLEAKIADGNELAEVLGVNRVKNAYEDMILKATGKSATYHVTNFSYYKAAKKNYQMFKDIWRRLSSINATPETFMTVMFSASHGYGKWKYPYLQWLSSEKAFQSFKFRCKGIAYAYDKSKKEALHKSPSDYRGSFRGAFANGFHILNIVKHGSNVGFLNKLPCLFATFLAYSETFRPEFVATSSFIDKFVTTTWKNYSLIRGATERYILPVLERGEKQPRYYYQLLQSREKVRKEEEKTLRRTQELTDEKGTDLWEMLQ